LVDDQVLEVRVIEHGGHGHRDVARGGRVVADLVDRDQAEAVLLTWSEPGQYDGVGAAPKGGHSSDGAGQALLMDLAVREVSRHSLAVLVLTVPGDGDGAHLGRDHWVRGDRGRSLVPHNLDLAERGPSAGDPVSGDRPDLDLPGGADPDAAVVDDRVRGRAPGLPLSHLVLLVGASCADLLPLNADRNAVDVLVNACPADGHQTLLVAVLAAVDGHAGGAAGRRRRDSLASLGDGGGAATH